MRFGTGNSSRSAPTARANDRSRSESNRNGSWFFTANARLTSGVSKETPRICSPIASSSDQLSRSWQASRVQPGVPALG
jgi:hypothetical protein